MSNSTLGATLALEEHEGLIAETRSLRQRWWTTAAACGASVLVVGAIATTTLVLQGTRLGTAVTQAGAIRTDVVPKSTILNLDGELDGEGSTWTLIDQGPWVVGNMIAKTTPSTTTTTSSATVLENFGGSQSEQELSELDQKVIGSVVGVSAAAVIGGLLGELRFSFEWSTCAAVK